MTIPPPDNTLAAANRWGIPDWRDPAAYGDVESWTFARWRWEFYRRRQDLRDRFAINQRVTVAARRNAARRQGNPKSPLQPNDPGFTAWASTADIARFGYFRIPNPRIGDQPKEAIRFIGNEAIKVLDGERYARPDSSYTVGGLLDLWRVHLSDKQRSGLSSALHSYPLSLATSEVAIVFSLDQPLEPQIENARGALEESYRNRGKPMQRRRHKAKWLLYLRTLDARAEGASWAEIARALLPGRLDEAGEDAPARNQKAQQTWEAADKLRSNF